jgi:release factor glutamine methyltransferase
MCSGIMPLVSDLSIKHLLSEAQKMLEEYSDSALLDAKVLLGFVLKQSITYLITWPERELTPAQQQQFQMLMARRVQGEPIAYLVGEKEFWSLSLAVAPSTLIPRPDTETLVELVLEQHQSNHLHCLDLGTGTGAIALALASENLTWKIEAVDYNDDAVALAKKNAINNHLSHVTVYQSDWFSAVNQQHKFDVIVSNPPYIDENDLHLSQGDVRFEPLSALVSPANGYADIEHIIHNARHYFTDEAWLYIEHGFEQGEQVRALFKQYGYQCINTEKDLSGNERISYGQYIANTSL